MGRGTEHLNWRKSSYSGNGANCVEVAHTAATVHARDSKNPAGSPLRFEPAAWRGLCQHVANR